MEYYDLYDTFVSLLITLIIIMDPFGNLPFFLLFTENNTSQEKKRLAIVSTFSAFLILSFFGISGDLILRFFHISIEAFQIAGGFIFFIYALQMLKLIPGGIKTTIEEEEEGIQKENIALVPLATPLLAGPGAITAVMVWQKSLHNPLNFALLILAIMLSCACVFLVFWFGNTISDRLGIGGLRVLTRLMGLLLSVIAIQFVISGLEALLNK